MRPALAGGFDSLADAEFPFRGGQPAVGLDHPAVTRQGFNRQAGSHILMAYANE